MSFVVLGVDPGLLKTGFGVIDYSGNSPKYLTSGVLLMKSTEPHTVRLAFIFKSLKEIIDKYSPKVISIEETFVNKNPSTSLTLGYARSVVLTLAGLYKTKLSEYSPNHIKKTITGNGHADKEQVKYMVQKLLSTNLPIKTYDESDALAIALTYHKPLKF